MFKYLFKLISFALILTTIFFLFGIDSAVFAETAIPISSKEEFNNIRNNLSGNYYLTCDIEFSSSDFSSTGDYYNQGKCFLPIGDGKNPFVATFDGNGYTVSGIKISVSGNVYAVSVTPVNTGVSTLSDDGWTGDYIINPTPKPTISPTVGVFGFNKGTIKNLNVSNCNMSVRSSNNAAFYVGGVAGAVAGGMVSNCYTDVKFTGTAAANFGLVGIDVIDNIENCYYVADTEQNGVGTAISTVNAKNPKKYIGFDFNSDWYMSGSLRRPVLKILKTQDIVTADLNNDKNVNLLDLVLLAQYVADWEVNAHTEVANVNFDFTLEGEDVINLQDVLYLAQNIAGWNTAVLY